MNILLIENQPLAEMIRSKRADIDVYVELAQSVEVVAADIKSRLAERYDVIIIGVHAQIGNALLSDNAGIQLLKLLRLHHVDKHVVLYSWMSREMLMGNLRNAIVFSKGVSFYRLPNFINEVQGLDFDKLSHETAEKNELLQLFRAEYNPDDRHFDANMFGVWQLMRVQLAYESVMLKREVEAADAFPKICEYMDSYRGRLVQYLHGREEDDVVRDFITAMHDERCAALIDVEEQLKQIESQIAFEANAKDLVGEQIEAAADDLEISELVGLYNKRREKKLCIRELERQKKEVECIQRQYAQVRPLRSVLDKDSDKGKALRTLGASVSKEYAERYRLAQRKPRIIYVDDMAEEGWADVLQRMVYGDTNENFVTVPVKGRNAGQIVANILDADAKNPADLLILDLRLKDERGYVEPSELSGIEVLKNLDVHHPSFPILIFTASNKVWSLKEAFKGNATAFWIKGGLGQNDEDASCVRNYLDLIGQIDWLTSNKWFFGLLAKIQKTYDVINTTRDKKYWWETKYIYYQRGLKRFPRYFTMKNWVLQTLDNTVETAQGSLRQLSFMGNRDQTERLVQSPFVMQVCDILEQIHHYKEKDDKDSYIPLALRMKTNYRENDLIKYTRHQAAHSSYLENIKSERLIEFVDFVMNYLLTTPQVFAQCLDADEPESINGRDLTPVGERLERLNNGEVITVRVCRVDKLQDGCRYYFRTDEKRYNIMESVDVRDGLHQGNDKVEEGDVACVKRLSDSTKEHALKIIAFFVIRDKS